MGKHGKGRSRKPAAAWGSQKKNTRDKGPDGNGVWNNFEPTKMQNELFEEYYKSQNIVPEAEWDMFVDILRTELPTTFRVTGSRENAETINDLIKEVYVPTMTGVELEGVKYDPPKPLEWYPGQLAWEVGAPKRVVRKQPAFKTFQRFLVGETGVGNLSRQEAVSMIPPLLMDVQPHHRCLDMCAAPGSKTAQIIEALNPYHTDSTGLLIANDADYKRTHMLVHQTGRMPTKGLVVTNFDATMIPNISLGGGEQLKFDRILADVPCSGDGTMRKNLEIWNKWLPSDGNSLHVVQLRILDRAMNLLKPGGRLVYSTCSFNPSENEAVVAAALNAHPGEFTIVDVSKELSGLKRHPGITTWKVATRPEDKLVYYDTFQDYRAAVDAGQEREKDKDKGLPKTIWPPANAGELNLERSLRLLPHDQNTGGFFVCVLEKKAEPTPVAAGTERVKIDELPQPDSVEAIDEKGATSLKRHASDDADDAASSSKKVKTATGAKKKEKRDLSFREDPFSFVDPEHDEVKLISAWFGLSESFPRGNLVVRNDYGNPLRTVYIVNDAVKAIIQNNDYTRLRMISAGVKAFVRQDSQARTDIKCKWRISSDAIQEVLQHIPDSLIHDATVAELRTYLEEMYPPIEKFASPYKEEYYSAELGNMIVRFNPSDSIAGGKLALPLILPVWKAKASMSLLIDKTEKAVLSERTFGENICKPAPPPKSESQPVSALPSGMATPVESETVEADAEADADADADEEAVLNAV